MKKLKIKQVKSTIGRPETHKKIIEALGFKKTYSTVIKPDNGAIRGMIAKVPHLVEVEEIEE